MKWLGKIAGVVIIVVFFVLASGGGQLLGDLIVRPLFGGSGTSGERDKFEKSLEKLSSYLNERLPKSVDKATTLDSTVAGPGRKFTYLHTLESITGEGLTEQQLRSRIGEKVRNRACSSEEMEFFFKNEITIIYKYMGSNGVIIGDIPITPNDCGY